MIEKEEANFLGTIDAGLDRIERIFDADEERTAAASSPAPRPPRCIQTYGFPPELFETLAAEHNLAFDWEGYRAGDGAARHRVGRRAEGRAVPPRPARSAEKGPPRQPRSSATRRPRSTTPRWWASSPATSSATRWTRSTTSSRSSWCSTRRRSTARWAARWATRGEIVGDGLPLRGDRHPDRRRLHAPPRPSCARAQIALGDRRHRAGRRRRGARPSAGPTRPRTCCTTPCRSTSASTPSSRARRSIDDWLRFDFTNPSAVSARGAGADRRRGERQDRWPASRSAANNLPLAEAREAGAIDALRREVSRRGPRGLDGRVQQGAVRRHAPGQHRPGRTVQDRRRGERGRRHAADHRPDRAGCAGADPPRRGDPRARRPPC